ncbi:MAG: hypothetical protein GX758_04475 [Tenericutes bacterium]|nr:hypothetical protein [Mycoplasmatota bacterium]
MAKNKMKLNYKRPKRERNKNVIQVNQKDDVQSFFITLAVVLGFVGLMYLGVLGLQKLGVFEEGYTKPAKETTISDEMILIGSVFNRQEKKYYVLFDFYSNNDRDYYIEHIVSKDLKYRLYKVDMSISPNINYISAESNPKARNVDSLKINDITLIEINNGKIVKYIIGSDNIVEFLSK